MLLFLYRTVPGRLLLKLLTWPPISRICGAFLDSRLSRPLIPLFIKQNHIDMNEFEEKDYDNFNEFFYRKIKKGQRQVDQRKDAFIAPCDGLLSVYKIEKGLVIPVKSSCYSIRDLLQNESLARKFDGGTCLVFRLCVNHYHRYAYVDGGVKTGNMHIDGVLHTVRPIALRALPVFTENSREYTLIHTDNFGDILQMEVGAMLVGKIRNLHGKKKIERGQEKGYFMYGGSTIIVLTGKDEVKFSDKLYEAARRGKEMPVKLGQRIGRKA